MQSDFYAQVAVARPVHDLLTYAIPAMLHDVLALGHVVEVPLGALQETGYVVGRVTSIDFDSSKVRPITRLIDTIPAFDKAQLDFYQWISRYYLAPLGLVIRTATPSQMRARTVRTLIPSDKGIDALTEAPPSHDEATVLREIIARPMLTPRGLIRRLTDELPANTVKKAISALTRRGEALWEEREIAGVQARQNVVVRLGDDAASRACVPRAGPRMLAVLDALDKAGGTLEMSVLSASLGASIQPSIRRLASYGALEIQSHEVRHALDDVKALGPVEPLDLTAAQRVALDAICGDSAGHTWLLFGVTGSGKTEVFLGAAAQAIARGEQVLVLVPEIGLTPQLVGRFKARFGERVAVLHSGLTASDRLAHWRRIRAGEADVLVGARSALFAPFQKLGLIVVDEEHDDSYKQDDGVRYHARDLAVVLGARHHAPVVLASATPSLESWHNAQEGRYQLLRLPERATPRPVPRIQLVDRREIAKDDSGKRPLLAPEVLTALRQTVAEGGQAVILYNRRGYATMVQCADCGGGWDCPNCGISLTLHRSIGILACHYCGLRRSMVHVCPTCGSHALDELGQGTERVVEVLARSLPGVTMARMDADTTAARGSHEKILQAFRAGEVSLLVGTQIVAKGHDIPNVRTVVVVSADQALSLPDFRAAERTVALIVQAAGRAGRGDKPGRVFVQTSTPDAASLLDLDDIERFLERERGQRRVLGYPPWTRLVLLSLDGVNRDAVAHAARLLAQDLIQSLRSHRQVDVLGPALAAMPRRVGRWRYQVILRAVDVKTLRAALRCVTTRIFATAGGGVRLAVDVDPRQLM